MNREAGQKVTWTGESETVSFTAEADAIQYITFTLNVPSVFVENVSLDKTSVTLDVGKTVTLSATMKPDAANERAVIWTSSNPSVAKVNENGVVTAVASGTAIITLTATNGTEDTSDDKIVTCAVTVNKPESPPTPAPTEAPTPDPTATPKPVPKTGDSANPALWLGLIFLGLIGAAGTMFLKARK